MGFNIWIWGVHKHSVHNRWLSPHLSLDFKIIIEPTSPAYVGCVHLYTGRGLTTPLWESEFSSPERKLGRQETLSLSFLSGLFWDIITYHVINPLQVYNSTEESLCKCCGKAILKWNQNVIKKNVWESFTHKENWLVTMTPPAQKQEHWCCELDT